MSGWYGKGLGMVQVEAEEEDDGGDAEETERTGCAERAHFFLLWPLDSTSMALRYFVTETESSVVECVATGWRRGREEWRAAAVAIVVDVSMMRHRLHFSGFFRVLAS